jgi:phosphopantetheinyl transferase (holo-ACP synthase)
LKLSQFARKVLTPLERTLFYNEKRFLWDKRRLVQHLAGKWAAKEAIVKASPYPIRVNQVFVNRWDGAVVAYIFNKDPSEAFMENNRRQRDTEHSLLSYHAASLNTKFKPAWNDTLFARLIESLKKGEPVDGCDPVQVTISHEDDYAIAWAMVPLNTSVQDSSNPPSELYRSSYDSYKPSINSYRQSEKHPPSLSLDSYQLQPTTPKSPLFQNLASSATEFGSLVKYPHTSKVTASTSDATSQPQELASSIRKRTISEKNSHGFNIHPRYTDASKPKPSLIPVRPFSAPEHGRIPLRPFPKVKSQDEKPMYIRYQPFKDKHLPPVQNLVRKPDLQQELPTFADGRPRELGKEKAKFEPILVRRTVNLHAWH